MLLSQSGTSVSYQKQSFTSLQQGVLSLLSTRDVCFFVLEQDFLDMLFGFTILTENESQYPLLLRQLVERLGLFLEGPAHDDYLQYSFTTVRAEIYQSITLRKATLNRLSSQIRSPYLRVVKNPLVFFFSIMKPTLWNLILNTDSSNTFELCTQNFLDALTEIVSQHSLAQIDRTYFYSMSTTEGLQIASDDLVKMQIAECLLVLYIYV